jgi:hypothetical protein
VGASPNRTFEEILAGFRSTKGKQPGNRLGITPIVANADG